MKRRSILAMLGVAAVAWPTVTAPALSADITVFSSGAPAEVARLVAAKFTEATGHRILFEAGTLPVVQEKLAKSDKADVVILPTSTIDALDQSGRLVPGSRIALVRVGIGATVRQGAALPDISTIDAVRKTLLDASSIVFPDPDGGGQAGVQIARMMARLGIAEAVKPKVTHLFAFDGGVAAVAEGKIALGLFNVSEILPVTGATLVGPLPRELQSYIAFSGAVDRRSMSPDVALDFLHALAAPKTRDDWQRGGFDLLAGNE